MPHSFETNHIRLTREQDRRVKLTDDQRLAIRANADGLSQRKLAALFGVSRRAVQFILDPEKLAGNKAARKARGGWMQYYEKEKHALAVKEHRRYKASILNKPV